MMLKSVPSASSLQNKLEIPHPTWIEIDLLQFKQNLSILKKVIGDSLYCLPIKSNAYGHGLCPMAHAAVEAGVDYLGVSSLSEGILLRRSGIQMPILVFGAIHEDQISDLLNYDLEFSISSLFKAKLVLEKLKQTSQRASVHLEVDTGMHRTGVRIETAYDLVKYIQKHEQFELKGIYSHFANSDDQNHPFNQKQFLAFKSFKDQLQVNALFHLANSGALLHYPESYFQMVRPGLLSFGISSNLLLPPFNQIKSCFALKSRISYFKVVQKDEGIGYGHTYRTSKQTRIVTVPIGYGDGYRRCLSNRAQVLIRGQRFPIVGIICMDQLMVDIGDHEAFVGDEVVLIGKQGKEEITLSEIAQYCDTIPYEILCGFNERIPRIHVN